MLVECGLQAIRGSYENHDAIAESHRFGDLLATLSLDAPGLWQEVAKWLTCLGMKACLEQLHSPDQLAQLFFLRVFNIRQRNIPIWTILGVQPASLLMSKALKS